MKWGVNYINHNTSCFIIFPQKDIYPEVDNTEIIDIKVFYARPHGSGAEVLELSSKAIQTKN